MYDAITGTLLDQKLVAKARNHKKKFVVEELGAYRYDTDDSCVNQTNRRPTRVKLINDVNKGDSPRPFVRSRLTVAETRHRTTLTEADDAQTLSVTPPYEALNQMF